jgi:DNA-binding response OmpR family regulator
LAVDDDPNNITIMEEILSDHYDLRTATTGEQALEIALDSQPDIVLLDVMMPGMDGYEVCQRLRKFATFMNTSIIMVTAKGVLSERIKGRQFGADDYITKPFDECNLLESIAFFLQKGVNTNSKSNNQMQ